MLLQRTLRRPTTVHGHGLHSGHPAKVTLKPAPPNSGIHIERVDIPSRPSITAHFSNVNATTRATTMGNEAFSAATVEHCLSAFAALRIDNAIIELHGPEVPIVDGSALPFLKAVQDAGVVELDDVRKYFQITKEISLSQGESYATILPYAGLRVTCTIDFPHPAIGLQSIDLDVNEYVFETQLASARTFGFIDEVKELQKNGLALGASLENAIGLNKSGVANPEGLRFKDEFVRHKALDALGDLITLGAPPLGHMTLYKAGHDLMNKFVKKIIESKDSYRIIELGAALNDEAQWRLSADTASRT